MATAGLEKPPARKASAGIAPQRPTGAERAFFLCFWSVFVGGLAALAFLVWPRFDPAAGFERFGVDAPAFFRGLSWAADFLRTQWLSLVVLYLAGVLWGARYASHRGLSRAELPLILGTGAIVGLAVTAIWMPRMSGP